MAHSHDHAHAHAAAGSRTRLWAAFAIIAAFLVVQVVGALLSGSLALLADAGHMASDLIGLVVALVAATVAARPATDRQTYGYRRAEVLGALVNGVVLIVVAVSVTVSAIGRLVAGAGAGAAVGGEAHEVQGVPMFVVAVLGLAANVAVWLVLRGGAKDSINMRGAYLEVLGDLIGSVLVIAAAVVILATGFDAADPIASLLIAALIVPRALALLRDVVRVLFESAPPDTDVAEIRDHLLGAPGVVAVHDVHVWQITSGSPVFSAHVEVEPEVFASGRAGELLDELGGCLSDHFDVAHSTFQLEPAGRTGHEQPQHP
ncbi:cation diffusion facilitator family transporter [Agromyces bauzanensis]